MTEQGIAQPGRGFLAMHPVLVDVAVSLGYILVLSAGIVNLTLFGDGSRWRGLFAMLMTIGIAGALFYRRRVPTNVLAIVFVLVMTKELALGFWDYAGLALAAYSAGAYLPLRKAGVVLPVAVVGIVLFQLAGNSLAPEYAADERRLLVMLNFVIPASLIGIMIGIQRRLRDSEWQRYHQQQNERVQAAELKAAQDRTAISREMHDVVGHSLTAIINVSDATRRASGISPEIAEQGLSRINGIARDALGETRSILDTLRPEGEPAPLRPSVPRDLPDQDQPQKSMEATAIDLGIGGLIDTVESAGITARFIVDGTPDPLTLTEGVRGGVYRIVQEAVTNVMRHSTGATLLTATLTYTTDSLWVQVHDNGEPTDAVGEVGNGLRGVTERASPARR